MSLLPLKPKVYSGHPFPAVAMSCNFHHQEYHSFCVHVDGVCTTAQTQCYCQDRTSTLGGTVLNSSNCDNPLWVYFESSAYTAACEMEWDMEKEPYLCLQRENRQDGLGLVWSSCLGRVKGFYPLNSSFGLCPHRYQEASIKNVL